MKRKIITSFLKDHLDICVVFFAGPVGLFGLFLRLENIPWRNFLYFFMLSNFLLLFLLLHRFYKSYRIYEKSNTEPREIYDFIIPLERSREEKEYNRFVGNMIDLFKKRENKEAEEKEIHELMIYRWVHQIKTPLSIIKLIAENHKREKEYNKIFENSDEIQYYLDQILVVYQLNKMENNFIAERIDLRELVKGVINDLKNSFIYNEIYPVLEIEPESYIYSDRRWLSIAVSQIVSNAIKYSPKKKSVVISAESKNGFLLKIEDEGCGIAEGDLDKIFELFYTGDNGRNHKESSGIGLYIVKYILNHLNHPYYAESDEGKGSRFYISFAENRKVTKM